MLFSRSLLWFVHIFWPDQRKNQADIYTIATTLNIRLMEDDQKLCLSVIHLSVFLLHFQTPAELLLLFLFPFFLGIHSF